MPQHPPEEEEDEDEEEEEEDLLDFDASEQVQARLEEIGAVELVTESDFETFVIHHHHHRPEGSWIDRVLGSRDDLEAF